MLTISWSIIDSYLKCPLRVRYELEGRQHSHSWAMAFAQCGHDALKAWTNNEDYLDVFVKKCAEYEHRTADIKDWDGTFTDTETGITQKAQIKDLLQKYTATMPKPDPSLVELYLTRELGDDILLTGRIDALLEGRIIDWKFTGSPKYLSPIQAIIYAILNGGPAEFDYHALIKARNPYCDVIPVEQTRNIDNLNIVIQYIVKPIAKQIESAIADPTLWQARPQDYLCQERRMCGYWKDCEGRWRT